MKIYDWLKDNFKKTFYQSRLLFIFLLGVGFLFKPILVYANYPAASWWNGNQCDNVNYTNTNTGDTPVLLTTWQGIQDCAYGPAQTPSWPDVSEYMPGQPVAENEWECTELVKRYLYLAYGATALSSTNGDQVVSKYANNYPGIFKSINNLDGSNSTNKIWPKVGDVVSYSDVHTAIITGVNITDQTNGNATLTLAEQNASQSGITTQQFVAWKIKGDKDDPNDTGSDTVTAWLTSLVWTNVSPSGTTFDQINAMSATSSSNVWAAGWEKPTGSNRTPVAYVASYNGTQWTKKSPGSGGIDHNYLMGITQGGGYVWTVGYITQSPNQTLAYKYNGSSWSRVTSDNPSATYGNLLLAAATDGSGTPWAAGYYYDGTNYQPIIEKWNGTKFAQQTISLPTGFTGAQLKGIAFSSSTNGWAVGTVSSSSAATNVMYHYDGTSWTPTVGINYKASLYAVTTVSDTEAWAIGGQNSGQLILHYVNGAWTEDTSFNGQYPSFTGLTSVSADSPTDVWIAGYGGSPGSTYTMHYSGKWVPFTTPSISGASYTQLNAITAISGAAWAGGLNQQSGQSYPYPIIFKTE